ncbi:MAG: Hpt domain-containing protein, partial [Cyanobacteria bacterium J06649_11]
MTETNFNHLSLAELFSMEVKTQVTVLNDNLLALENKSEPTEELTELMRAAHSIKGAARIVQVDAAVSLAHVMEDYFVAVQEKRITLDSTHVDILLQAVDTLLLISDNFVNQPETSFVDNPEITSLVTAIANLGNEPKENKTLVKETIVNQDIWTQAQTNPQQPIL